MTEDEEQKLNQFNQEIQNKLDNFDLEQLQNVKEKSKEIDPENYTDEELKAKINELLDQEKELQKKAIEYLRKLPAQKILSKKELEILMSMKEEELTDEDKLRVKWATLRLKHHRYSGTGYTASERKKAKVKRKLAKKSRKANR